MMPLGILGGAKLNTVSPVINYLGSQGTTPTANFSLPSGTRFIISIVYGYSTSSAKTITLGAGWNVLYNGAPVAGETGYFQHLVAVSTSSTPSTSFSISGGTPFVWAAQVWGINNVPTNTEFARSNGQLSGGTWPSTNAPVVTTSLASALFYFQAYQFDDTASPVDNETFPTNLTNTQSILQEGVGSNWRQRTGYILQSSPGASPTTTWVAGGGDAQIWGWQLATVGISLT